MFYAILAICFLFSVGLVKNGDPPKVFKEHDPVIQQYNYEYKAQKEELKVEYEKSNLPKSGYMLTEQYEEESKGKARDELKIEDGIPFKQSDMKYVPQHTYKLVRYNNPPGSPELNLPRKVNFDRQINAQGIVSSDFTKLVYASVYYYAEANCTSCSVYVIPLDTSLSKLERVKKANVAKKIDKPIFQTDTDITTEGAFRTFTPVDYSADNRYIIAKEKLGWAHEGIWKTNLWVHDFQTGKSKELSEIREAITNYWHNVSGVEFNERRWDIYPLGFDKNNPDRILVCAYAYTGDVPSFLGTWSIDTEGQRAELVDLDGTNYDVSIIGFRLVYDSYVPREEVEWEADRQAKIEEKNKKDAKKHKKKMKKAHKKLYHYKLKKLKAEYRLKIREYKKSKKKGTTSFGDEQGVKVDADNIENTPDIDYERFNAERNKMIEEQQAKLKELRESKNKKKIKEKTKQIIDNTTEKIKTENKEITDKNNEALKNEKEKVETKTQGVTQQGVQQLKDTQEAIENTTQELKDEAKQAVDEANERIQKEADTLKQNGNAPILRE